MKRYFLIIFALIILGCKKNVKPLDKEFQNNDSIVYSLKNGIETKTIYYPSKKTDTFVLRSYYENNKLIDSGYFSKKGFIKGNLISFESDSIRTVYEYINIDGASTVNQFWKIKGSDTLSSAGNFYEISIFDSVKQEKPFQVQIALSMPIDENFTEVYFLRPKEGYNLNSNFTNYNDIKYDTIRSLIHKLPKGNDFYDEYWSKRIVAYRELFKNTGVNYIRGILVEKNDSLAGSVDYKSKERYLFVNKKVIVPRH